MTSQIQRPLRGSRISSFYPVKTLPALSSLDSAFQLQEYISLLIRLDVHDVNTIVSLPVKTPEEKEVKEEAKKAEETKEEGKEKEKEVEKADKEEGKEVNVDEACWIYEQLRRLAQDLTHPLITTLQQECTRASCPEMKAGEWLYLCVAHGNDGAMEQCCAIDYILHTLDSATALLNSPRAFPSRLQIPQTSHRHFSALARRLGRIFAHAYFHHREAFEQAEAESSLYARFLALTAKFHLVPSEFLVIPPSAVGFDLGEHREDEREIQKEPPAQQVREQEHERERKKSKSPPSLGLGPAPISPGDISPRRVGRNRTDTMVHSDARDLVEDLANRFGNSEADSEEPEELDVSVKTARPGGYFVEGEEEEEESEGEIPPTPIAERVTGGIPHAELGLVEPEASIVAAVVKEVEREKEVEEKILKGQEAAKEEESPTLTPVVEVPTLEEEKEPAAAPAPAAEPASAPVEVQSTPEETPAEEEEHEKTFAEVVKEAVSEPLAVPEEPKVEATTVESEVPELKDEVTEEAPAAAVETESTPVPVEAEEEKSEDVSVPEEVSAPAPEEAKDENETSVPEEVAVEEATSEKKDEVVPAPAPAEHEEPNKEEAKEEEKAEKVEGGETAPASA